MQLFPITPALESRDDIAASELLREICRTTLAMYPPSGPPLPWVGYLADEAGTVVGTCAFKAPPDSDGVEIAYFTLPGHEGRGIATQMAQELITIARAQGVRRIRAQTLPSLSASTRILEKLGFRHVGTRAHPEDGDVWEWQLHC